MTEERGEWGPTSSDRAEVGAGRGTPLRAVAFVALVALVTAAASILPYAGVGLVALAPFLRRAGALLGPTRAGLVPPIAMVAIAPMLLVMPLLMLTDPVVESGWRCGTAMMSAVVVLPFVAFVAGAVSAGGAVVLAVFTPRLLRWSGRWLRAVALLVGVGLVAFSAVRLMRFPQPEDWTDALRVAARAPGIDTGKLGACHDGCEVAPLQFEAAGAARTLLMGCKGDGCTLRLGDAGGTPLAASRSGEGRASPGGPVEVRVHDGLRLAVVTQQGRALVAFDVGGGDPRDVPLRDVAREVAPSPLAALALVFGVGIAILRTRRAAGERAAVARLRTGVEARVDDAGVVHPADGGASFRPPGAALAEGPAIILARPAGATYRSGSDRGTWVLPGTRAAHVDAHEGRATVFDWEALGVLCLAGAPLFAAALRGLVL